MKQQRSLPRLMVSRKAEALLQSGHPWVYDTEVLAVDGAPENGCVVDVCSEKGRYLGSGFLSECSKIRVRVFSRNANDVFDAAFWRRRLGYALGYRKAVMGEDIGCCRLIFGEADAFPGLTVDRFEDILVAQVLSVGIERIRDTLFSQLVQLLAADGVAVRGLYLRNDSPLREREGLPQEQGWYPLAGLPAPQSPLVTITENGIRYRVNVAEGQKTGFFLDQKYNRRAVAGLARGLRVLDCFTHTGSFALNAAAAGAAQVTGVDISEAAVALARENAALNGLQDRVQFLAANVFDLLVQLRAAGGTPYDLIILDPPAFTKSRRTLPDALRGYREINLRAMQLLGRGGYLATCSCSHFADEASFKRMLLQAAHDAGVQLRQIQARQQAPDHPILWGVPQTEYLKFFIFQVV